MVDRSIDPDSASFTGQIPNSLSETAISGGRLGTVVEMARLYHARGTHQVAREQKDRLVGVSCGLAVTARGSLDAGVVGRWAAHASP